MPNIVQKSVSACFLLVVCAQAMALPTVNISASDPDASEAGPETGSFTITRSGDINLETALSVQYLAEGVAVWNTDYTLAPHGVQAWPNLLVTTIPANETSITVTLTAKQDNNVEGTEAANFTLQGTNKYSLGTDTMAQIDISDDVAEVNFSPIDTVASEAGPTTASFSVNRTNQGDVSKSLTVFYLAEGTATWSEAQSSSDYILAPYGLQARPNLINVSIPANELSVNVTLTPNQDNRIEGAETAILTLQGSSRYTLGNDTVFQADISDDVAEISISSTDTVASEAGPGTASFTISRTNQGDVSRQMTVYYLAEGTATWTEAQFNSDYTLSPYALQARPNLLNATIPANELSVTVILTPRFDDVEEGDEEAVLTIQGRDIYKLGSPVSQAITIIDFRQLMFKDSFEELEN